MKKQVLFILLAVFLLGSCASKRPMQSFMHPEIGTIATKGVGESLVEQGQGRLEPVLMIPQDEVIGTFELPKGEYSFRSENAKIINFGKISSKEQQVVILLKKEEKEICAGKDQCAAIAYSLEMRLAPKIIDSFQRTLLYNGKTGNLIKLAYREFSNNYARQAFSNEVTYDLAESTIVGYKGARIEIISATNTEITYKFLSGFDN